MSGEEGAAGRVARSFADAVDDRDWASLASLLAPGSTATLVHTGETFTGEQFVAFNRDYPGGWRFTVTDLVASGDRAVLRARVTPASGGDGVFHVASFLRVADGLVTELVEVWGEELPAPPAHRPGVAGT
ncbi:nuclear transport factor 2 family protein [Kineococcus endophyticus]|uniref:Nuclear transport factor 2 family protein n=1 Tax=Kineococcus endophyticus TaxID=1181883 RepID=A0ABV3P2E5_9ACTN